MGWNSPKHLDNKQDESTTYCRRHWEDVFHLLSEHSFFVQVLGQTVSSIFQMSCATNLCSVWMEDRLSKSMLTCSIEACSPREPRSLRALYVEGRVLFQKKLETSQLQPSISLPKFHDS